MCLAVPGRLLSIEGDDPAFRVGRVDFCGVKRTVNLAFTPDAEPGDFLLVHVGFALTRVDEEEAHRTYQYLAQIGALAEEGLAPLDQVRLAPLDQVAIAPFNPEEIAP
ncbi:MAG TPA: HypC/HybG/HupF family hydrogenase formation chaperone [Bryobacteraceae bacterium]|jgi:hydrogenase expression/formation protein HypC|nr:HypC/HybG/HupF family hydrogenase formation chaperone [Bryobacteraceae bacterium]